jgi:DNA-binding NarL/FixJ family response regulator
MSVSPSVLLLSIAIGGPVLLLALAVLYHGALIARQKVDLDIALAEAGLSPEMLAQMATSSIPTPALAHRAVEADRDLLTEHVSSLVTRSADALAIRLEEAMAEMQTQLAHQRSTLETLLSEPARLATAIGSTGRAAGEHIRHEAPASMSIQIARLIDEGLSDRSIARELRIGLEEVKIARSRGGRG